MYKLQQVYSTFKKPQKTTKNKQKITKQTFKKKRTKQNKTKIQRNIYHTKNKEIKYNFKK